ncbi:Nitrogenase molybdenum-iron protein beta chain [Sporomusa silvacetica DSM 10669]|uniref:Nitrogenase molybdenum-iron protein beta chain n=1 Tax=Sporomusa silvacetica DSM 10669 TaxID=1123289 RepID=A0ABZ3IH58_9FIRM|nr:nitrogenase component 1 [Sporomusa silvacetica]OZC14841.1 nitrogenase molybdenum-iron protein beta chain [Sporomusa silvacetica DSM 10669]
MAQYIEQVRHVCSLGALQSVLAIERAVPILHAGPGCGQKLWGALGFQNGCQGSGYVGGHSVPCTNIGEKEVIFGGNERLRDIVDNSLKIIDADLFVVVTGCTSDIVGDDVGEVTRRFQEQGKPVVYAETGGFKGTNFFGHELVIDSIIDQYLQPAKDVQAGLVNIWSVVPFHDAFWVGNLKELESLISEIGLTPNVIFGPGKGLASLNKVPQAQFNLLISPWVGLKNVRHLEEKFKTPYLHYPVLPIGPTETAKFLRTVGKYAGIEEKRVEKVISRHEADYYYYIERSADVLLETRLLPRRFVTITDSFYALGVSKFLVNDLGLLPETQYITDGVTEEYQENIAAEFQNFVDGITANVVFTNDGGVAHEDIRKIKFRGRPLILGSSWDKALAKELNGYQLSVSMPVSDRLALNRAYTGYQGALRLTEDIYSLVLADFQ